MTQTTSYIRIHCCSRVIKLGEKYIQQKHKFYLYV